MNSSIPNRSGRDATTSARTSVYGKLLVVLFVLSLPFVNPTVHGDGVGYYAYARALLIQHDLRFEEDWKHANEYFATGRVQANSELRPDQYTPTGYVDNHFTVGPAILWSPFLIVAHIGVKAWDAFGGHVRPDGFSMPYLVAMAIGTAVYGFLGLLLSFALAGKYVEEKWAFLATVGVWLASSLPVYMYFNPAWSHAHSAFAIALFLWYWQRTWGTRTATQWMALGLIGGLSFDIYFPNAVFLVLPLTEILYGFQRGRKTEPRPYSLRRLIRDGSVFLAAFLVASLPTFITRQIVYGGALRFGAYTDYEWDWRAPHAWKVLFSADHGALTWTPIIAMAIIGMFLAPRRTRALVWYIACGGLTFFYVIASYPYWDGMASFGNRFLISLTTIFVIGVAFAFERSEKLSNTRWPFAATALLVLLLSLWNGGFIFQWGEHLVPVRGAISFREMAYNQFFVVPQEITSHLHNYLFKRKDEMRRIEKRDIEQLKSAPQN